jgi:hypothetical protein
MTLFLVGGFTLLLARYKKISNSIIMTKQEKRTIPDEEKGCNVFILFILFLSSFVSKYDGYKNPK